jgi:hypothetical protein
MGKRRKGEGRDGKMWEREGHAREDMGGRIGGSKMGEGKGAREGIETPRGIGEPLCTHRGRRTDVTRMHSRGRVDTLPVVVLGNHRTA